MWPATRRPPIHSCFSSSAPFRGTCPSDPSAISYRIVAARVQWVSIALFTEPSNPGGISPEEQPARIMRKTEILTL